MKITRTRVTGAAMGVLMAAGAGVGLSACDGATTSKAPAPTAQAPAKPAPKQNQPGNPTSQVQAFQDYTAKNGTAGEQAAVSHVVHVHETGSYGLSMADVTTDYSGDLTGPNQGAGKNVAEAYAQWKHTSDGTGLVTVYSASGDILSNGNY